MREGETVWGNPAVSSWLLNTVTDAGFDLVRIPVTWSRHMGPGSAYAIEPHFLERVSRVMGHAHDAGLYAIINLHHDSADGFETEERESSGGEDFALFLSGNNAVLRPDCWSQ